MRSLTKARFSEAFEDGVRLLEVDLARDRRKSGKEGSNNGIEIVLDVDQIRVGFSWPTKLLCFIES